MLDSCILLTVNRCIGYLDNVWLKWYFILLFKNVLSHETVLLALVQMLFCPWFCIFHCNVALQKLTVVQIVLLVILALELI